MSLSPLLRAILNMAAFHRDHEKFYAASPRQQAVGLQRHARTLLAFADRWSTVRPAHPTPYSPFEGAEDLNDPAALQLDGVLFMEGEGEPIEITRLVRDVRTAAGDSIATGDWLATAMQASWNVAAALLEIEELAAVLGERHRIPANDWQAANMSTMAGRLLQRAADILDHVDFAPAALRGDLAGTGSSASRLYSAAELIGGPLMCSAIRPGSSTTTSVTGEPSVPASIGSSGAKRPPPRRAEVQDRWRPNVALLTGGHPSPQVRWRHSLRWSAGSASPENPWMSPLVLLPWPG